MRIQLLRLLSGLRDRAYRALFVETQIETVIPFQIRTMRVSRGWTQKQLAERAEMAQGRISLLESVNYEGAVNVKTLVKLAEAFDVGLVVRFAPFSEIAEWSTTISKEHHDVPDFETEFAEATDGADVSDDERTETIQVAAVEAIANVSFGAIHDVIAA